MKRCGQVLYGDPEYCDEYGEAEAVCIIEAGTEHSHDYSPAETVARGEAIWIAAAPALYDALQAARETLADLAEYLDNLRALGYVGAYEPNIPLEQTATTARAALALADGE